MKSILTAAFLLLGIVSAKERIVVFHAGSLSVPFAEMEKEFEKRYPRYDVVREAAGSRACARKITDIGKAADIMASADYKVIDNLLMPDYAGFNIRFATNEMVIAYSVRSKYANEIDPENWPEIVLRKGVKTGHSNPNLDPCGYRAVLAVKLAELHYGIRGFYKKLMPYGRSYKNGEELEGKVIVRPKETDLLALLESGAIDYLFIYRSVARQHGLRYIELPDAVNLGRSEMAGVYGRVSFEISGKVPGSRIVKKGEPMIYGICIVDNGGNLPKNPEGAKAFVDFLLSREGEEIMRKNGQNTITPPIVTGNASRLER